MRKDDLKSNLEPLYNAALDAVNPEKAVEHFLSQENLQFDSFRRILLAGFGKAGVPMARAVERRLGNRLHEGIVIVKDGYGGQLAKTRVFEAAHPEPDERGRHASQELVTFLQRELTPDDLLLVVISGGGSALFLLPVPDISLADKQRTTAVLLACGATIQEINTIRKHLSQVKGGQLLRFANGARVISLVLSDVIGDEFASIASGPTAPDPTTYCDCLEIIRRYGIEDDLPARVIEHIEKGASGKSSRPPETPKPNDPLFAGVRNVLVANNLQALQAAAQRASELGFAPLILSSSIYGNTGDVARVHVAITQEVLKSGHPIQPPCCLISGGETTVKLTGDGKGGRNMEFVLQCLQEIREWEACPVLFASVGSDGTDGPTDAAGAFAGWETLQRASDVGINPSEYLKRNDSYHFFSQMDQLIITGPTRTNVMDLRFVLIGES